MYKYLNNNYLTLTNFTENMNMNTHTRRKTSRIKRVAIKYKRNDRTKTNHISSITKRKMVYRKKTPKVLVDLYNQDLHDVSLFIRFSNSL